MGWRILMAFAGTVGRRWEAPDRRRSRWSGSLRFDYLRRDRRGGRNGCFRRVPRRTKRISSSENHDRTGAKRIQKSEVRSQEVRKSEVRNQKSGVRSQKSECTCALRV